MREPALQARPHSALGYLTPAEYAAELMKLMTKSYTRETLHDLWLQTKVWFQFEMGKVTPEHFAETMVRDWELTCDQVEFLSHFERRKLALGDCGRRHAGRQGGRARALGAAS